ncbi:transcriptional regulator with XRE-family HTH domain [Bradyrhizobium niftali]
MKTAAKRMKQRSAGKPDIELGKRIRLRRVEMKISQAELGEKLGVSFQQVQKYEKGVNRVGAARLQQIASAPRRARDLLLRRRQQGARSREPAVPRFGLQPPPAARLQQDQGPDGAASARFADGIDRGQRSLIYRRSGLYGRRSIHRVTGRGRIERGLPDRISLIRLGLRAVRAAFVSRGGLTAPFSWALSLPPPAVFANPSPPCRDPIGRLRIGRAGFRLPCLMGPQH